MNVRYYSNKEKGIITAVLELDRNERNEVYDIVANAANLWRATTPYIALKRTYSAVVRLQEGDTWDEEYGKMLARRKAYGKYLVAKTKKMMQVIKMVEKDLNSLHKVADQWIDQSESYWDKTIELSGIEE